MITKPLSPQYGKATTQRTTFSRETAVSIPIHADPTIIWKLLTNAADYPRWNSTIVAIEGTIQQGNTIHLKSTLDAKRVFRLQVQTFEPEKRLVWGDNQGSRVYTLEQDKTGHTLFTMSEKIGGILFPLFARFIPPFDTAFEQFAADLKKEAELIQNAQN